MPNLEADGLRQQKNTPLLSAKNGIQFAQTRQNEIIEDWKNVAWFDFAVTLSVQMIGLEFGVKNHPAFQLFRLLLLV